MPITLRRSAPCRRAGNSGFVIWRPRQARPHIEGDPPASIAWEPLGVSAGRAGCSGARWAYGTTPTAATICGDAALRLRTFSDRRILNELTVGEHDVRSKPCGLTGAQRLELDLPPSRIGKVRSAIGSVTH